MVKSLNLYKKFGETLVTREIVKEIFSFTEKSKINLIDIDFKNIQFISRSFADEFYKQSKEFEDKIDIKITNSNSNVVKMLSAVSKTQNKSERFYKELPVFNFTELDALNDYMMSI